MTSDSYDFAALEAENHLLSDRDLMLRTLQRTNEALVLIRKQNGAVAEVKAEVYGDSTRSLKGLKPLVHEHDDAIKTARTTVRAVLGVVGVLGVGNLVALISLVAR